MPKKISDVEQTEVVEEPETTDDEISIVSEEPFDHEAVADELRYFSAEFNKNRIGVPVNANLGNTLANIYFRKTN